MMNEITTTGVLVVYYQIGKWIPRRSDVGASNLLPF